jgi:glucosamine-6-phosphate deaminase
MAKKRFKPIVSTVTISRADMELLLTMPLDDIQSWSPVKVVIYDTWRPVMEHMAKAMVDKIKENNAQGRISTFICPVGPTEQYPIAAEISNREHISWKNVWTFNMDEYLDWQGRPIPEDHPMSFHGAMKHELFDRLDEDLRIPEAQRWFPDPFNPDAIDNKIDQVTGGQGVDICFGGIGEHGHVAFNEAPDLMAHYVHMTVEDFKNSSSRVLPHLNPETLSRAYRTPLYTLCPPGAVTLGMRPILQAKTIMLSTAGVMLRFAAMHPPSIDYPVTFIQEHADPMGTVTLVATRKRWGE